MTPISPDGAFIAEIPSGRLMDDLNSLRSEPSLRLPQLLMQRVLTLVIPGMFAVHMQENHPIPPLSIHPLMIGDTIPIRRRFHPAAIHNGTGCPVRSRCAAHGHRLRRRIRVKHSNGPILSIVEVFDLYRRFVPHGNARGLLRDLRQPGIGPRKYEPIPLPQGFDPGK